MSDANGSNAGGWVRRWVSVPVASGGSTMGGWVGGVGLG